MGGVPGPNRGHLREGTASCCTRRESSLRGSARGTEPTGTSDRGRGAENDLRGPGWAGAALKGQGQGGVCQEMQRRPLKRPETYKIILSLLLSLLFLKKKKRNGLLDYFSVKAALAGGCAK